jgi:hypothetical protein
LSGRLSVMKPMLFFISKRIEDMDQFVFKTKSKQEELNNRFLDGDMLVVVLTAFKRQAGICHDCSMDAE